MALILYELAGKDDYRFSPYCWRTIQALLHKGLTFERRSMKFTDRACIEPSGQERVPVLVDGERWIADSWDIAAYLDQAYGDRPALFEGDAARAEARFINSWADNSLHPAFTGAIVHDVWQHTHPDDRDWFKTSREERLGRSLEAVRDDQDAGMAAVDRVLTPLRTTLQHQDYLSGGAPAYADYILLGSFMWPRSCSPKRLIAEDDPIYPWRERMLDLFEGFCRNAPGYPV